jgi:hypothetical protein
MNRRLLTGLLLLCASCGAKKNAPGTFTLTLSDPDVWCDIAVDKPAGKQLVTSAGNDTLKIDGYAAGTVVTLTATAHPTFVFGYWNGTDPGGNDATNPTTVTMTADKTVTITCPAANTTPGQATLTLNAGAYGTVTASPAGPSYAVGTRVTLTATPSMGYKVASWSGSDNDSSTSPINHVTMTADKTVSVTFAQLPVGVTYTLTLSHGANGTVSASPPGPTYNGGTTVSLTATPSGGYQVDTWTGTDDDTSHANTNQVTMTSDKSVNVTFKVIPIVTYTIQIDAASHATLNAQVHGGSAVTVPSTASYPSGTQIDLSVTGITSGYHIASWSGTDSDSSKAATNTATANQDRHVTVTLSNMWKLTVQVSNTMYGYVYVNPPGANYDTTQTSTDIQYANGTSVDILAHEVESSWAFYRWTVDGTADAACTGGTCCTKTVSMTMDHTVYADFPLLTGPHCPP